MSVALSDRNRNYRLHQLQKEKELLLKVRLGDFDGAWASLEDILDQIFKIGLNNIGVIKVRVLELMLVLSRAVADGGADYEKVSIINHKMISDIAHQKTFAELSKTARWALQAYVKHRPVSNSKYDDIISRVKMFIMDRYFDQLTLEQIARIVHISPYYLSHLFKEVEGISVIEYLTKIRMDNAKLLLREQHYTIYEVAEKLGYKEPSYFTKVFRKMEGKTPTQYRNLG